ncbi:MAG TPA: tagaturonate reductase [Candidatus Deferrimicrobium sp.]|nr:tagaturonate reductase [Candidatus Deferrimicrobium sp.]
MNRLNRHLLLNYKPSIDITLPKDKFFDLPVKVLQFGEGRFIRAFLNFFIDVANHKELFNGRSIVIQPRKADMAPIINAQDGLFTLCAQGLRNETQHQEFMIISSIKEAIAARTEWDKVLRIAELPTIQIIASNTTEAGLVYDSQDRIDKIPPDSFPGKIAALLYHRYQFFDGDRNKGLRILPLELIENNGDILRKSVLQMVKNWNLDKNFINWLQSANIFYNSIVDRIVTGYPKNSEIDQFQKQLGYEDKLFNIAELYHSWIIEADEQLQNLIPFKKAGLNIKFVSNIKDYFIRKVRILNGAHTSMVPIAYLSGKNFVKESIDDPLINIYIQNLLEKEVIPFINLSENELISYKNTIIERFRNPFLEHNLLTISLYSISKMKLRVLPSILEYYQKFNSYPPLLLFAFAAFMVFMRIDEHTDQGWFGLRKSERYEYQDDFNGLETFNNAWKSIDPLKKGEIDKLATLLCQNTTLWDIDLTKLSQFVSVISSYIYDIIRNGMIATLKQILRKNNLVRS